MINPGKLIIYMVYFTMIFMAVAITFCFIRAAKGPRFTDRIVAANFVGTLIIALMSVIAVGMGYESILDVVLVYALLNFLSVTTLSRIYIKNKDGKIIDSKEKCKND